MELANPSLTTLTLVALESWETEVVPASDYDMLPPTLKSPPSVSESSTWTRLPE